MATVSADLYSSASVLGSSSTNTKTSSAFTPTANSLLVVCIWFVTDQAASGENVSLSSTHSGTGTWVEQVTAETSFAAAYTTRCSIWSATIGASPGSGTVTMTHDTGTNYRMMAMSIRDITEVSYVPAGQTDTETGTTTTPTLTFGASMAATSVAVTALFGVSYVPGATDPTGFSEWATLLGDGDGLEAAYDASPSGSSIAWSNAGDGTNERPVVACEFAVVSGQPAGKRWGGVAFAGATNRGRW